MPAPDPSYAPFPTTHWTMVDGAGAGNADRLRALGELLRRYLPALRLYLVRNHRLERDRADDLLQGFLADRVLGQDLLARADRTRGRFRTFLATALDRYALNRLRHDRAGKRSPPGGVASLGEHPGHDRPRPSGTPADLFDLQWARLVLRLAVDRMWAECDAGGRADVWAVFDGRVLGPTVRQAEPEPLDALVGRLGVTPERASALLGTGKRMFARNLRAVVGEYADGADVDEEVRALRAVLAGTGHAARSADEWCT